MIMHPYPSARAAILDMSSKDRATRTRGADAARLMLSAAPAATPVWARPRPDSALGAYVRNVKITEVYTDGYVRVDLPVALPGGRDYMIMHIEDITVL